MVLPAVPLADSYGLFELLVLPTSVWEDVLVSCAARADTLLRSWRLFARASAVDTGPVAWPVRLGDLRQVACCATVPGELGFEYVLCSWRLMLGFLWQASKVGVGHVFARSTTVRLRRPYSR